MFKILQIFIGILFFFDSSVLLSQECNVSILATTSHLQDNNDGTISDSYSGLQWKKCSEGQKWNVTNNSCTEAVIKFYWQNALQRVVAVNRGNTGENLGQTNWRVPNIKELASITEQKCWNPSINISVFPSTPSEKYWTSSFGPNFTNLAWVVEFYDGTSMSGYDRLKGPVRLVR